jgi:hypothetical protein
MYDSSHLCVLLVESDCWRRGSLGEGRSELNETKAQEGRKEEENAEINK